MRSEFNFSEAYKEHPLKMHSCGQKETAYHVLRLIRGYVCVWEWGGGACIEMKSEVTLLSFLNPPSMSFLICKMGMVMVLLQGLNQARGYRSFLAVAWHIGAVHWEGGRERKGGRDREREKGAGAQASQILLSGSWTHFICRHLSPPPTVSSYLDVVYCVLKATDTGQSKKGFDDKTYTPFKIYSLLLLFWGFKNILAFLVDSLKH